MVGYGEEFMAYKQVNWGERQFRVEINLKLWTKYTWIRGYLEILIVKKVKISKKFEILKTHKLIFRVSNCIASNKLVKAGEINVISVRLMKI